MVLHLLAVPASADAEDEAALRDVSRLAVSLAVWMGSRSIRRQMPVATRIVLLAIAATVRATNGSRLCQ